MDDSGSDEDYESGSHHSLPDSSGLPLELKVAESKRPLDSVIYPIAPKIATELEEQVDLTVSPAFLTLDELFNAGSISGEKVARLKAKYQELNQFLRSARETESHLLHRGKELMQELQNQKNLLERSVQFPASEDNDVNRLRNEFLKFQNKISASEEQYYQLQFQLESLDEERRLLSLELEHLPKLEDIESQIKDVTQEVDQLKVEIAQRSHEKNNLVDEHRSRQENLASLLKLLEESEADELHLKDFLVKVHLEPVHLSKQIDLSYKHLSDVTEAQEELRQKIHALDNELQTISLKKSGIIEEKEQLARTLDKQRSLQHEKEKEVDLLIKECELARERQAELLGDRTSLELKMKHCLEDKKTEHDLHSRRVREKDRDLKALKRAELQFIVVEDGLTHTKSIFEKLKSQVDSQPKDDGSLFDKRRELQREVDVVKRACAQQNSITSHERQRVEQGISEEERLLSEQGQLRIDLADLTRLVQIKADEREQKARDYLKAEVRYHKAIDDLKAKQLTIEDNSRKFGEVQRRLEEFAKLYDVIKNERNKCVNLIQTSTQRVAEMREKIKILQNETEILRTAGSAKERLLAKAKLKHNSSIVIRDSLRNELSKHRILSEDLKDQIEQQRLSIAKLNEMINKSEEVTLNLRRQYESAIQDRNHRGIQLIERNEEVCVLYEKLNVQGSILRNGDIELQNRVEEIRFLEMEESDLKRSIDLLRGNLPAKQGLDNELATLQIQFVQCQEYMRQLERQLEDPTNAEHVRLLSGSDPTTEELDVKAEQLSRALAVKEESLLEKDLIYERVEKLVEKSKHIASCGEEDTMVLAQKVNVVQGKIKDTTRKIMSLISELSMNQAKSLQLQQEVRSREVHIEQCYTRMEHGEAPCPELEREWMRYLRKEILKCKDLEARQQIENETLQYTISGGTITTAEPRPNAYVPDDDTELPLPRPYGASAPFKPSEAGANMRHIRKPVTKPVLL